jgi:ABC-type phosphate/phosphonate transport system substrate-binding protein
VSESVVGEVNGNDASVAVRTWAEALVRQTGVQVEYDRTLPSPPEQMLQKIRSHLLDAYAVNTLEFLQVAGSSDAAVIVDESYVTGGDEYLLLVPVDSTSHNLSELRGHSLIMYKNPRMCLAGIWLETQLATQKLGASEEFLGHLTKNAKLARVVLPVFFHQADACIVTRRGFNTMCELNPQLAQKLRCLAASPKLLTTFMAFHKESPAAIKKKFQFGLLQLYQTAAGQQALTLFESKRLVLADTSLLRSSSELLKAYEKVGGKMAVSLK